MSSTSPTARESLRVLVVDDDADVRHILGERLQLEGFESAFAHSGEDALVAWLAARSAGTPFDVLILDIQMLGLSGVEVLRLVRQLDQDVTILMISGLGDLSRAVQSLRQGADDYISKPIKIWDLRDRISTARGRRRALARRSAESNSKGLGWGSWIRPAGFAEEPPLAADRASARPAGGALGTTSRRVTPSDLGTPVSRRGRGDHRQVVPEPGLQDPSRSEPPARDLPSRAEQVAETRPAELRADDTRRTSHRSSRKGQRQELDRESPSRGRSIERTEASSTKGREKGSEFLGAGESGPGESSIPMMGASVVGKAPGREAPPDAELASRLGGSSHCPGGEAASVPPSSLDSLLLLGARLEQQRDGWKQHGALVAERALRIGQELAGELALERRHLEGLELAARLHSLGLIRARGQGFRDLATRESFRRASASMRKARGGSGELTRPEHLQQSASAGTNRDESTRADSPQWASNAARDEAPEGAVLEGSAGTRHADSGTPLAIEEPALGQDGENLELVSRILASLRTNAGESSSPMLEVAERILSGVDARRLSFARGDEIDGLIESPTLLHLIRIFELADHWVHLTSAGLEGLGPRHAHGRISERLEQRGNSGAFPWLRALQTLSTAS